MAVAKIKRLVDKVKARIEESKKDGDNPPWLKQVAMLTGVLAAVGGFLAVRSTTLTNDAIYESNQAILAQAESSDAWGEYQADSIKARIVETALATANGLTPEHRTELTDEAADLRDRQPKVKQAAGDKANERDQHLKNGLKRLGEKDLLGYAGLASQVGIALASVAALVRMRTAFYAGILAGVAGVAITLYAFATHFAIVP
jgi:hypothetical protein